MNNSQLTRLCPPSIGVGTWSWGNQFLWGYEPLRDDNTLYATFSKAISLGLNFFDTADSYGTGQFSGRSEILLGKFASRLDSKKLSSLTLATKLAPFPWRLSQSYKEAFYLSKIRLQGRLDRVQLHWSTARYTPFQEGLLIDTLADLIRNNNKTSLGISNIGPKGLINTQLRLASQGIRLSSLQIQFSLLTKNLEVLNELIPLCRILGVEVIAYSPLALGLLCLSSPEYVNLPIGPRKFLYRHILPQSGPLLCLLNEIATSRKVSTSQVSLNWCRANGAMPIVGLRTPEQAIAAAEALNWTMNSGELADLNYISQSMSVNMPENPFQSS